jgi:triacylglycerol lipase
VILVHGWFGSPRELSPLKAFLDANGFRSFIAILPGENNIENAEYLRDFVTEVEELTGVDEVHVVGFSMGGLALRYYIRNLGGDSEVDRYVSIDTPQYGDGAACVLSDDLGGQMCPWSEFLNDLNQPDDTPGDVSYTTIINEEGGGESGRLRSGATEVFVSGPHGELLATASVHEAVLAALRD